MATAEDVKKKVNKVNFDQNSGLKIEMIFLHFHQLFVRSCKLIHKNS